MTFVIFFSFVGCATEWIGFGFDQYRGRVFQSGTAGVNGVRTPWTTADQDKDVTRTFFRDCHHVRELLVVSILDVNLI